MHRWIPARLPVVEDHTLVGVLTQRGLLRGLAWHGGNVPVAEATQREYVSQFLSLRAATLEPDRTHQ